MVLRPKRSKKRIQNQTKKPKIQHQIRPQKQSKRTRRSRKKERKSARFYAIIFRQRHPNPKRKNLNLQNQSRKNLQKLRRQQRRLHLPKRIPKSLQPSKHRNPVKFHYFSLIFFNF